MTLFSQNVSMTTPIPTDSQITTIYFKINGRRRIRLYLKSYFTDVAQRNVSLYHFNDNSDAAQNRHVS